MSITIPESGLLFGEYEETDVFHIEKTELYKSLKENIKSVEFALYRDAKEIVFVEAKSSSPNPKNYEDFDEFILEVYEKFSHSVDLFFSILIKKDIR